MHICSLGGYLSPEIWCLVVALCSFQFVDVFNSKVFLSMRKKHEAPPNVCFGSITKKNVTKNSVNLVYDSSTALLGLSSHDVASLRITCLCPSRVLGSNFSSGFALINQNQSAMQWLFNSQEHV